MLHYKSERWIFVPARGAVEGARRYEFLNGEGEEQQEVLITTGMDVTILQARAYSAESLLAFYSHGTPEQPRYAVAVFYFGDERVAAVIDHGADIQAAVRDFESRQSAEV